jgi:hypothetical protein
LTGACDPPNSYGRSWTSDDSQSLAQYQTICPQAKASGMWSGDTPPDSMPFEH